MACSFFLSLTLFLCAAFAVTPPGARDDTQTTSQTKPAATTPEPADSPQKIVRQGVAVEFEIEPVASAANNKPAELMEGEDALVRFRITDTATNTPLAGIGLSAWMSLREGARADDKQCREKIQSFMQGSLRARPDVDLNAYYVLALNKEPNISVIDPLLGFGGSKLLTLVMLRSPGEDWVLTSDRRKLFVTMPLVNQVAVVDTTTWKVVANIDTGKKPTRLALQSDEQYLWVGNDGLSEAEPGTVTVIDIPALKALKEITIGAGHHEIAVGSDNRYAFITNKQDSTLSVIDIATLVKVKDIKTGASPVALALSPLSKSVYVASESDGVITIIDGRSPQAVSRLQAQPGLRHIRFAPGGRHGFALNPKESLVHIFDAAANRMLHSVAVGKNPDQISFTNTFGYVRSAGTEAVNLIRLATVGKELDVTNFPGGQAPPAQAAPLGFADAIVPVPEGNGVLVANPADKVIYYYAEGMAAPMGNFQNYRREPRSIITVDRSLRESASGVYTTIVKMPRSGNYDIAFLSDSPRVIHCFDASVKSNPSIKQERKTALRIEHLTKEQKIRVGEKISLRFKLFDTATNAPKDGLKDVRVLMFLVPGIWQKRELAQPVGEGVYEVSFTAPQSGMYMVFVESPSQGVQFRQLPSLTLQATEQTPPD